MKEFHPLFTVYTVSVLDICDRNLIWYVEASKGEHVGPVRKDCGSRWIPQPQKWQECDEDWGWCNLSPSSKYHCWWLWGAQTDLVIRDPVAPVNDDMRLLCEDTRLSGFWQSHLHSQYLTNPLEETKPSMAASVGFWISMHENHCITTVGGVIGVPVSTNDLGRAEARNSTRNRQISQDRATKQPQQGWLILARISFVSDRCLHGIYA